MGNQPHPSHQIPNGRSGHHDHLQSRGKHRRKSRDPQHPHGSIQGTHTEGVPIRQGRMMNAGPRCSLCLYTIGSMKIS